MKRNIAAVAIVAALTLTMTPAAQAAPHFGQRWTTAWGFIVWVQSGGAFYMRVVAHGPRATIPGT